MKLPKRLALTRVVKTLTSKSFTTTSVLSRPSKPLWTWVFHHRFSAYAGARILQGLMDVRTSLQAARGITGDKNSNKFARALYNLLKIAHSRYTLVQTREWVDDLVQRVIGPVSRIQHNLERAGLFVLRGVREAGFTVSHKTTLAATDRSLSTRSMQKYRASGFPVQSAMSAADLGIDRGFAARR